MFPFLSNAIWLTSAIDESSVNSGTTIFSIIPNRNKSPMGLLVIVKSPALSACGALLFWHAQVMASIERRMNADVLLLLIPPALPEKQSVNWRSSLNLSHRGSCPSDVPVGHHPAETGEAAGGAGAVPPGGGRPGAREIKVLDGRPLREP